MSVRVLILKTDQYYSSIDYITSHLIYLPHHEAVVRIAGESISKREVRTHAKQLLPTVKTITLYNDVVIDTPVIIFVS